MKHLATAACVVGLVGCAASPSPDQMAKQQRINETTPHCSGEADCTAKWEAAQRWVVDNAGYKIQIQSSVLIQTDDAYRSPKIAVQVTKEPEGGGRYKIVAKIWCQYIFGCVPNSYDALLDFNQVVGAATP